MKFLRESTLGVWGALLAAACGVESSPPVGTGGSSSAGVGGAAGASVAGTTGGSVGGSGAGVGGGVPSGGTAGAAGGVTTGGVSSGGTSGSAGGAGIGGNANGGLSGAGQSGNGGLGGAMAPGGAGAGGAGSGGVAGSGLGGAGTGGVSGAAGAAGAESKFLVFLLLGQSNMEGAPQAGAQDRVEDPRIKVLAYDDCAGVSREYGQWYTAYPPLHSCGAGVGPGDYFAKTLLESLPEDYTIGLVPCAVNGAPIDLFRKGVARTGYDLPPDNHWATGYEWIISRAQEAQKTGVIRGVLFHQGESNYNESDWVGKVQGLVNDLRTDLALGEVPFLAGELYYNGCCMAHNTLIAQLATSTPNAHVISASGLNGIDQFHFDLAGQRTLGTRYGEKMQEVLTLP